jgi:hypothetical protein
MTIMAYSPISALGTTSGATASSASVLIKAAGMPSCNGKFYNAGTDDIAYIIGATAPTAVFATACKLPGKKEHVVSLPDGAVYVAVICNTGLSSTFYCDLIMGE